MLSCFLQRLESRALPAESFGFDPVGNIATEALERRLADQEFGRLLVATALAECDGAGAVAVRFPLRATRRSWTRFFLLALGRLRLCGRGDLQACRRLCASRMSVIRVGERLESHASAPMSGESRGYAPVMLGCLGTLAGLLPPGRLIAVLCCGLTCF